MSRTRKLLLSLILAGTATGCASPARVRPAQNTLDRAIQYTELPRTGKDRHLSNATTGYPAVPNGVEVDINSSIRIHVDTGTIQLIQGYHPADAAALYPNSRAEKLTDTLAGLKKVIDARLKAVSAFEKTRAIPTAEISTSSALKEFTQAVADYGRQRSEFNSLPIWEDGTFAANEVEPAFDDATYNAVGALLQRELNAAQSALQQSIDEANKNAGSIQLTAFLEPANGDVRQIHLEGYDSLPNKEIKMKDGFVMDADDRKAFEAQYNQTVQIAKQAEQVRSGEVSLNEAINASGSASLKQLAAKATELKSVVDTDWPQTIKTLQTDLRDLNASVKLILEKQKQAEWSALQDAASEFPRTLASDLPIAELKSVCDQISSLRLAWQSIKPDTFIGTFNSTQELLSRIKKLSATFESGNLNQTQKALDNLIGTLRVKPASISNEVWLELSSKINTSASFQHAQTLNKQLLSLQKFLADGRTLLQFTQVPPVKTGLQPQEVKSVPLNEAVDTAIDLPRTARLAGDRIFVSATLKVGQSEVMRSDARFGIQYFGHHSVLAPSVILARPFKSQTPADSSFQFAPSVAWLYKNMPRDTDEGYWSGFQRFAQMGIGMHVAFLNQNSQKGAEVGLGGAISFWKDRLVAGVGVNLMNNSKGYLYIGSNLVPLLQSMGYGQQNGAGIKP